MSDLKNGATATDPRLGRIPDFDPRSRAFPVRALSGARPPRSFTWACPVWLNQQKEGGCVGWSMGHVAGARPLPWPVTDADAGALYHLAQTLDPWPGEAYSGTTVLAGAKALVQSGYAREYRWAFGVDDLAAAISWTGPAVIGISWHEDMFTPDPGGTVRPTGAVAGGHAICVRGYSVRTRRFLLRNSWGRGWGLNGDCLVGWDDMAALLADGGEAAVPLAKRPPGQPTVPPVPAAG